MWWCVVLWSCFAEYQVCLVQTDTIISKFFSAANRYAFLMKVGCVVLRVASRKQHTAGHDMWFYPILRAYNPFDGRSSSSSSGGSGGGLVGWESSLLECHDHILIDEDLSNLKEVLMWCRANDDICRQIADNSKRAMVVLVVVVVAVWWSWVWCAHPCSSLFSLCLHRHSQAPALLVQRRYFGLFGNGHVGCRRPKARKQREWTLLVERTRQSSVAHSFFGGRQQYWVEGRRCCDGKNGVGRRRPK